MNKGLKAAIPGAQIFQFLDREFVTFAPGLVAIDQSVRALRHPLNNRTAAEFSSIDPRLDRWLQDGPGENQALIPAPIYPRPPPLIFDRAESVLYTAIFLSEFEILGVEQSEVTSSSFMRALCDSLTRFSGIQVMTIDSTTNVDFVLDGCVSYSMNCCSVTSSLRDRSYGHVVWTSSFVAKADSPQSAFQTAAAMLSANLEAELPRVETRLVQDGLRSGKSAYSELMFAITLMYGLRLDEFRRAGDVLARVTKLLPRYAPVQSWLALWHIFHLGQGWAIEPMQCIEQAGVAAEYAISLDPTDARGLSIAGHVRAYLHRRLEEAMPLHEKAIQTNPGLPLVWHLSGVAHAYAGQIGEARLRLNRWRQLGGNHPHSFYGEGAIIITELLAKNHSLAASTGRAVTQLHPRFSAAYKPFIAALGHLGETVEAARALERLIVIEPGFCLRSFRDSSPFALTSDRDHYIKGLVLAGVPEQALPKRQR